MNLGTWARGVLFSRAVDRLRHYSPLGSGAAALGWDPRAGWLAAMAQRMERIG